MKKTKKTMMFIIGAIFFTVYTAHAFGGSVIVSSAPTLEPFLSVLSDTEIMNLEDNTLFHSTKTAHDTARDAVDATNFAKDFEQATTMVKGMSHSLEQGKNMIQSLQNQFNFATDIRKGIESITGIYTQLTQLYTDATSQKERADNSITWMNSVSNTNPDNTAEVDTLVQDYFRYGSPVKNPKEVTRKDVRETLSYHRAKTKEVAGYQQVANESNNAKSLRKSAAPLTNLNLRNLQNIELEQVKLALDERKRKDMKRVLDEAEVRNRNSFAIERLLQPLRTKKSSQGKKVAVLLSRNKVKKDDGFLSKTIAGLKSIFNVFRGV